LRTPEQSGHPSPVTCSFSSSFRGSPFIADLRAACRPSTAYRHRTPSAIPEASSAFALDSLARLVDVSRKEGRSMPSAVTRIAVAAAATVLALVPAHADRQQIAPGTGRQDAVVIDSGANGICETTARSDDLQPIAVGHGSPFEDVVRCGVGRIANTTAAGDDRQLVPVGGACQNPNTAV